MPELKFRDGKRVVPDYMARLMAGIEVKNMTYEEAIRAMNHKMENDHVERAMSRIVDRHFMENPRG
ncbi:MAG TPA: hypothetical protein VFX15_02835 [Actinomycetes bacterium]|nr:hypothetical protein [Actinomycetes bacterium]